MGRLFSSRFLERGEADFELVRFRYSTTSEEDTCNASDGNSPNSIRKCRNDIHPGNQRPLKNSPLELLIINPY